MTNNEIKNFMEEFASQVNDELERESNSQTLYEFWKQYILSLTRLDESWFVYIGSEEMMNELESYKEDAKRILSIEKKFSRESIHFLNTFSENDMGEYIEFYPLDSHIGRWGSYGLKIISILTRNGILEVNKDNVFIMSRDNYNLYKKAAKMYGII